MRCTNERRRCCVRRATNKLHFTATGVPRETISKNACATTYLLCFRRVLCRCLQRSSTTSFCDHATLQPVGGEPAREFDETGGEGKRLADETRGKSGDHTDAGPRRESRRAAGRGRARVNTFLTATGGWGFHCRWCGHLGGWRDGPGWRGRRSQAGDRPPGFFGCARARLVDHALEEAAHRHTETRRLGLDPGPPLVVEPDAYNGGLRRRHDP